MDRFEQAYEQYRNQANENEMTEKYESTSNPNLEKIVAVRKNDDGDLIAFQTESGRELDYIEALSEAKAGKLAHVDVFHKYGRDILRSEPDGISENNLDSLPEF
ncbi:MULTISPECIES: DUF3892 domain-containing protein [Bacillus]|uniref:DUF3892 domain-containing protein n=2 Tax=Bacillus TaxID=1386 RepID=A0A0M4FIS0_9BACI|nr:MULTISPECIES: DUF3892 domain-containing protein [Bacillus]ALC81229.1 hypothetical protein AM592_06185 [Bacillus gobiensis]MBP1080218.1 hypothetical protein [Bacillus capparidis]MED1094090.1 DUF3892 domain-containing protein [Bacillus capparidis]